MTKEKAKEPQIRFKGFTNAWEQRKLGEVFTERSERSGEGELISVTINSGVVKASELDRKDNSSDNKSNYKKVKVGDIAYNSMRMWQGASGYSLYDGILSPAYTVIIPRKNVESKFFAYDFKRHEMIQTFKRNSQGLTSDTWNLKFPTLKTVKVMVPSFNEQRKISAFFERLDYLITLHQRKCDLLSKAKKTLLQKMFPKNGKTTPEIRFKGFTGAWEQRKLGEEFEKVNERNDGSFGREHWISVAKMYFQDPDKVQSNNIDTRTYVMRKGDIAFEGHPNVDFKFGRFVANDIGAGVVSELFPIYRHKQAYDNNYWKHAIQLEHIMAPIFAHSITSSGNSSNKLDSKHFLRQKISVPKLEEQKQIGSFFANLDHLITLHQHELEKLQNIKKSCLKMMFV